jgi:hypothetical protein
MFSIGHHGHADVAQLVAHNLAKVGVAGSNPVVRSQVPTGKKLAFGRAQGGLAERRGKGLQIPLHRFKSGTHLQFLARSALERPTLRVSRSGPGIDSVPDSLIPSPTCTLCCFGRLAQLVSALP